MAIYAQDGTLLGNVDQQTGQIKAVITRDGVTPGLFQDTRKAWYDFLDPRNKEMPDGVKTDLLGKQGDKKLRLNQHVIYAVKPLNATTIRFFNPSDSEQSGITNLNNGQLDTKREFVAKAMSFQFFRGTDNGNDEEAMAAVWEPAVGYGPLLNSRVILKISDKTIFDLPGEVFQVAADQRPATVFLDKAIYFPSQTKLDLEVRLPGSTSMNVATDFLRFAFYGMVSADN